MRVEKLRIDEPDLAWSVDDEGLKLRVEGRRSLEASAIRKRNDDKRDDDDDGPGSSGVSITAKILPFFSFSGTPSLA